MSETDLESGLEVGLEKGLESCAPLPVQGVSLAAVEAGVRYPNRLDLVAISFAPATRAAAVFTRNAFCAAPVTVAREHLHSCGFAPRLLLINTGNANAGTGDAGLRAAKECCLAAAQEAGLRAEEVLPFSTGVIGEDLPSEQICVALPGLLDALASDAWASAAQGILTTDTRPKIASRRFSVGDNSYVLTGIAKGAGMLRPDMATMLAFFATDAPLSQSLLQHVLRRAVDASFHRITVDGDTSTNDAVLLAATGAAGGAVCDSEDAPLAVAFFAALESLSIELAQGLVRDGEGASKFVQIDVSGGASEQECLDVAFTVAHSPLVKTALFSSDPNWGRILAAIGRAGVKGLDVRGVRVAINDLPIAEAGCRAAEYNEERLSEAMQRRDLCLTIDLGRGHCAERVWTSDFSYDYVRINAEYRS
ncbi:MAG: bifunctional glutamate N-acetyltransferase/amino-acid acetyltransferase ArgJ [Congregibacter sp.]